MAVSERTVKNKRNTAGEQTGRSGVVYDVNIKYKRGGQLKTYSKKGFVTKKEALQHETDMRNKLENACYTPPTAVESKQTVQKYLDDWIDRHGKANLRESTMVSYKSIIRLHINPYIGDVPIRNITPAMLDNLFQTLQTKGLSSNTVRYVQRILSVSFEHARKYHYIETNPARDTITKFGKANKTPAPYTVQQVSLLMTLATGTSWEIIIALGGLYGLRISEILGLRWRNVNLGDSSFGVVEQLPFKLSSSTTLLDQMAPVKSGERILPITAVMQPLFERQRQLQAQQRTLLKESGSPYFENDLVVSKSDGAPLIRENISAGFGQFLRHNNMPHIRFHDLRHSAATNIHELTGDFYTVSQILGHSLKGVGIQLNMQGGMESVTERYVSVRLDRKREVLTLYHNAVFGAKD